MAFRLMTVDDSATMRAIIAKTLRLTGLAIDTIREASDGAEALEILKKEWIDLVFTDLNMPVMSGYELVDRLSRDGVMKTVPVVVVSSVGTIPQIEELKAKGVKAYLRKPFRPEDARKIIETVLEVAHADGRS